MALANGSRVNFGGVQRIRVHVPSDELHTTILRGVGTRATCGCGYKGPSRRTYMEARKDLRMHRMECEK